MDSKQIRQAFLNYFEGKGHTVVKSSSLVPANDPTLMFTNAGMNQFKDCFLGADVRSYRRAVTCQKVMRIAGKHNDFENVGVTARHHTFFEMLGNFSFGDYFKKEAITFGWEFVTEVLKIPASRLWVTVYEKDDEAAELWRTLTAIKPERIVRLGEADNFWAMGETGPCGPCTEMHVFCGKDPSRETAEGLQAGNAGFLEIWNLVFMQFDRDQQGKLNPLPKPSVDTGMGLERITSVIQGGRSNYDTDLLRPIIAKCEELSGFTYEGSRFEADIASADPQYHRDIAMRVIADHSRAMACIIADGVLPGSEGRAYILRRIIRRAIRHGRVLNFKEPFLTHTTDVVVKVLGEIYPELIEQRATIARVVDGEERKFHETLDSGLQILRKEVEKLPAGSPFPGDVAFLLHDTYGFPLDLTQDALKAHGREVDVSAFEHAMNQQRQRSRDDRKSHGISYQAVKVSGEPTEFLGYETTEAAGTLQAVAGRDDRTIALVFDRTPFYAESGGQIGDRGMIRFRDVTLSVEDTQKLQERYIVHYCRVQEGTWVDSLLGEKALLSVDRTRRDATRAHHSATHLLHAALREVLGPHVKQAGSRVAPDELRFDFSHFEPIREEQLRAIEHFMNDQVRANHEVVTRVMETEEALKTGAMALFGEKYGSKVRVVEIGERSRELCGGTHVSRSGDIGVALVRSETGVAAGVRRIECVVAQSALALIESERREREEIALLLKSDASNLPAKISRLLERSRQLEREVERLHDKLASVSSADLLKNVRTTANGIKVLSASVDASDPGALRSMVDQLRVKLGSGVVVLTARQGEKALLVAGVTSDLPPQVDAGKLVKEAASIAGGKGGGKADFAQAGGLNPSLLASAVEKIFSTIG